MKRIVILLLLICLAKLAGAQTPERMGNHRTTTAGSIAHYTPAADTHGVNITTFKALRARSEQLQAENQVLKGELRALRAQAETGGNVSRQELKESTAKVLFIVCLVAGLLLMALVSGRVFSRDSYAGHLNLHNR
jgi:ribosomal protein L29